MMKISELILVKSSEIEEILSKLDNLLLKVDKIQNPEEKKLYTNNEVQKLLSISAKTLQNRRDKCEITFIKTGAKFYYRSEDIKAYLIKNQQKAF